MAEPARAPEPSEDLEAGWAHGPKVKIARSGWAIWSLLSGLIGTIVFFLPGVLETLIALPAALRQLAELRSLLAISSGLAILTGAIAISQIRRGTRRGMIVAVIGLVLGGIGILGFFFGIG